MRAIKKSQCMSKASVTLFISASVMLFFSYGSYAQQAPRRGPTQTRTDIDQQERQTNEKLGQGWEKSLGGGFQNAPTPSPRQTAAERAAPISGRWRRVTSPQGRFSVELPEGWEIRQNQTQGDPMLVAQENLVTFNPVGEHYPGVGVMGWIPAHVWQELRTGSQDADINRLMCQQVSALKFYSQILAPLLRRGIPEGSGSDFDISTIFKKLFRVMARTSGERSGSPTQD